MLDCIQLDRHELRSPAHTVTGYLSLLLALSIIAANRGAGVWTSSVKEAQFAPPKVNFNGAMGTPEVKPPMDTAYPPQPVSA